MSEPDLLDTPEMGTPETDTPYTSTLLRYHTQLKNTAELLDDMNTICNKLHEYVPHSESIRLPTLIDSTKAKHDKLHSKYQALLGRVEQGIHKAIDRPNLICKDRYMPDSIKDALEQMGSELIKLKLDTDVLSAIQKKTLDTLDDALQQYADSSPAEEEGGDTWGVV
ncbi:hypothetical protein OPT61_g865 [Boeremia exigua]|uniref:Uncharacterized protein n=1 Tax=Boeremia exigua TaxID=749465 RepID=A0ACC2ISG8_9PLEO|nr:hypothetical protein OPT61_g865 [Boeremia exigua]